jgi:biotin transporter BioY
MNLLAIPDRLPSLVLLVGFWIAPAAIGWAAAEFAHRNAARIRAALIYAGLMTFVIGWSAAWFLFQLHRMPPYIPGATLDPTYASPQAVAGLAVVAIVLVVPVSAVACALAFRSRWRSLERTSAAGTSV